jgi:cytoskeletal protein CcmA (bactofilin family)
MLRRLMGKEARRQAPPQTIRSPGSNLQPTGEDEDMSLFSREQERTVAAPSAPTQKVVESAAEDKSNELREPAMEKGTDTSTDSSRAMETHSTGRDNELSVIGKTLFVKGEVEAAEDMLVEGRIQGSIKHTANRLIIGVSGVVNADINAKNLIVEGTVEGNIVGSESVVIKDSADVRGNIYTSRISIADGAQFSGTVDMDLAKSPKH